jgi:hypothetical protein
MRRTDQHELRRSVLADRKTIAKDIGFLVTLAKFGGTRTSVFRQKQTTIKQASMFVWCQQRTSSLAKAPARGTPDLGGRQKFSGGCCQAFPPPSQPDHHA